MKEITIISIEKRKRSSKFNIITTEDDYIVSEDMVIKHHLFKDKTFTEKEFKQVIEDILEDEFFNKVLNLLSISYKSEYEIIQYIHTNEIKNKTFLKEKQVQNIISKLIELGYIDDERLSNSVVDYYIRNNKGPLFIKQKLKEKKVAEDIINRSLEAYDNKLEQEIIIKLIEKENNKNLPLKKFKMNLCNKLIRNGFNSNLVYRLVDNKTFEDNSESLIEKDYLKIYNRIKDKNKTDSEKKQLIINGLLSKGYEYSLVKKVLKDSSNL